MLQVTKNGIETITKLEKQITEIIQQRLPNHNIIPKEEPLYESGIPKYKTCTKITINKDKIVTRTHLALSFYKSRMTSADILNHFGEAIHRHKADLTTRSIVITDLTSRSMVVCIKETLDLADPDCIEHIITHITHITTISKAIGQTQLIQSAETNKQSTKRQPK